MVRPTEAELKKLKKSKLFLLFAAISLGLIITIFLVAILRFFRTNGEIIALVFIPAWAIITFVCYKIFYPK